MTNPTETERTLIQLHFSSAQLAAPSYARLPLGCPLLGAQPGILRRPTEGFPISYVIYISQGSRDISILTGSTSEQSTQDSQWASSVHASFPCSARSQPLFSLQQLLQPGAAPNSSVHELVLLGGRVTTGFLGASFGAACLLELLLPQHCPTPKLLRVLIPRSRHVTSRRPCSLFAGGKCQGGRKISPEI